MRPDFSTPSKPAKKGLQKRTKSRAKRLGLEVKSTYTRGEARKLRKQLARQRGGLSGGTFGGGPNTETGRGRVSKGKGTEGLMVSKRKAVNTVQSGAGAARKGKTYTVAFDTAKDKFVHLYKRKKGSPRRVVLRDAVARAYGYTDKDKS